MSEYKYKGQNRSQSKTAKPGLFWCSKCDRDKVGQHGKCETCGHVENKKKIRTKKLE